VTTATCGSPDSGLGSTAPNGNAGRIVPLTAFAEPTLGQAPVAANGNAGSVIPPMSAQPTVPGGSLVTPPQPQPQVTAIVLPQAGVATIVLVGE
jgi:hypothetical protein